MHLIEILLPLADSNGKAFPVSLWDGVKEELTGKFGGLTAHSRSPAQGLWKGGAEADDIVIVEVMAGELDRAWWQDFRAKLERRFNQDAIIIRASRIETI